LKPVHQYAEVMSQDELERLHEGVLSLLEDPGMQFQNRGLLNALEKAGAQVDYATEIARLPRKLVSHNRLGTIHINDNYRDADPDMMFNTVAFWDNLEMYYFLNKTDFNGWNEIDFCLPRDDRVKAASLSVKMTLQCKAMADKLYEHRETIEANLKGYRFVDNMDLITDLLFSGLACSHSPPASHPPDACPPVGGQAGRMQTRQNCQIRDSDCSGGPASPLAGGSSDE